MTPAVEDGESDNDDDEVVARTYAKMMSNRNPELEEGRKKGNRVVADAVRMDGQCWEESKLF